MAGSFNLAGNNPNYLNIFKQAQELVKPFTADLPDEYKFIGPYMGMQMANQMFQSDPKRLKEQLDVIGPYFKDIGRQQQQFGLQSNLAAAGIDALGSIPKTVNTFRAVPLQGLFQQTDGLTDIFASYGSGGGRFSGIRNRLGVG